MSNTQEISEETDVSSINNRSESPIIITVPAISKNNQTYDQNILTPIVTDTVVAESASTSGAWWKYTPDMLKTPRNDALKAGPIGKQGTVGNCRKTDLKTKLGQWAATKQLFVNTQEECFKREHELTMSHKKQKHEQEMRHSEELHQEKLWQMREEHQLKMMEIKKKTNKMHVYL